MRLKIKNKLTFFLILGSSLVLALVIALFIYTNFSLNRSLKEKPQDIVIANITTQTADVYWKSSTLTLPTFVYKKETSSGTYTTLSMSDMSVVQDITQNLYIYKMSLTGLDSNSRYIFRITTPTQTWNYDSYSFSTKDYTGEVNIPNIVTGSGDLESYLLITAGEDKYMFDTGLDGSWAADLPTNAYTTDEYANYKSEKELKNSLINLLPSTDIRVYAYNEATDHMAGANCIYLESLPNYTHIPGSAEKISVYTTANKWVSSCAVGNYAWVCYDDVYCRSINAGVDPTFTLAIWIHESDASNYAFAGLTNGNQRVDDFGTPAEGVFYADFSGQLDYFLKYINEFLPFNEISSAYCTPPSGTDPFVAWAAQYHYGSCDSNGLAYGLQYVTSIKNIYKQLTNEDITWQKIAITPIPCGATSSSPVRNESYHACDGEYLSGGIEPFESNYGTEYDYLAPSGGGSSSGNNSGSTNTMTTLTVNGKDVYCTDSNGCICKYSSGQQITTSNGYTCPATYTGAAVVTQKICCKSSSSVSTQWPYNCTGTIVNTNSCTQSTQTITLGTGVNFIQALDIINTTEVPITTAKGLISYTKQKVITVASYTNGSWNQIVQVKNGSTYGEDFNLTPGKSYMIITTEPINITAEVLPASVSLELTSLSGWNLVSASSFGVYSLNSKSILQNTTYSKIQQIAIWDQNTSSFIYTIKDSNNNIYGESKTISSTTSFFINVQ